MFRCISVPHPLTPIPDPRDPPSFSPPSISVFPSFRGFSLPLISSHSIIFLNIASVRVAVTLHCRSFEGLSPTSLIAELNAEHPHLFPFVHHRWSSRRRSPPHHAG